MASPNSTLGIMWCQVLNQVRYMPDMIPRIISHPQTLIILKIRHKKSKGLTFRVGKLKAKQRLPGRALLAEKGDKRTEDEDSSFTNAIALLQSSQTYLQVPLLPKLAGTLADLSLLITQEDKLISVSWKQPDPHGRLACLTSIFHQ